MHVNPFPVYPALQVQVKDPRLLVHTAFVSQGLFGKHSFISAKHNMRKNQTLKFKNIFPKFFFLKIVRQF